MNTNSTLLSSQTLSMTLFFVCIFFLEMNMLSFLLHGAHDFRMQCTHYRCFHISPPDLGINTFKPEFTIVICIHYKPRIAVAILDLWWMKMI